MLKKITEPQAQYFKTHTGADSASITTTITTPTVSSLPPKRTNKMKVVGSVIAATLFLVVGIAGVMTALRQQEVAGPVAPNAPASIPQAASQSCSLEFTIGQETVVIPSSCGQNCSATQPCNADLGLICMPNSAVYGGSGVCTKEEFKARCATAINEGNVQNLCCTAPPIAQVSCGQKRAYLITQAGAPEQLLDNSIVSNEDTIQYDVLLFSDIQTAGPVTVVDTLDANTTWDVEANAKIVIPGVAVSHSAGTVTMVAQPFSGSKSIYYRVKVNKSTRPFTFTNTAKITNDGTGKPVTEVCTSILKTAPAGSAVCESKTAYTQDASGNVSTIRDKESAVKAGTEYFYSILVSAKSQTTGSVVVTDTLPVGIEYLRAVSPTNIPEPTKNAAGQTIVTVDLGVIGTTATLDKAEEKTITFAVKIAASTAPSTLKNTVTVKTGTNTTTSPCEHTVVVPPEGIASCLPKEMHNAPLSENKPASDTRIAEKSKVDELTEFYYRVKVVADKATTGAITVTDVLPSSLQIVSQGTFTNSNGTLTQTLPAFTAAGEKVLEFKVKVKAGVQGEVTNIASVKTGTDSKSYSCESSLTVPSYTCNSACDDDTQCQKVKSEYRCTNIDGNKKCRLGSNTESTSCDSVTPTPTPTPTPSATPTIGCNDRCTTNADCTNPSHVCYQTTDGGRCRLDDYVTSATCSSPSVATATPKPQQPNLPKELPVSGPEDWANWLKAGLVTLGIGAVLLLLL